MCRGILADVLRLKYLPGICKRSFEFCPSVAVFGSFTTEVSSHFHASSVTGYIFDVTSNE